MTPGIEAPWRPVIVKINLSQPRHRGPAYQAEGLLSGNDGELSSDLLPKQHDLFTVLRGVKTEKVSTSGWGRQTF